MEPKIYSSILQTIGNTPLMELKRFAPDYRILVKMELFNPGGSIKDRLAMSMIDEAEKKGQLKPGMTIIEPTAGNTGIGLAIVGSALGYKVILCVPDRMSIEKIQLMKSLGATVILTPGDDGVKGSIGKCEEIFNQLGGQQFAYIPNQFCNPVNPECHFKTTAKEIHEQLGDITPQALVIGAGTGGTFTGIGRYFKEYLPKTKRVLVEPNGSVFQGLEAGNHFIEGIGNSFIPEVLDISLADDILMVQDEDSVATAHAICRTEGFLAGGSSGANIFAALEVAKQMGKGSTVITLAPDSAERYISKGFLNENPVGDYLKKQKESK